MVSKYDVFELLYKHRFPMKPIEVVKALKKDQGEYSNIHHLLRLLTKENLVTKTGDGFQARRIAKTEILHKIIYHCVRNGLSYNNLLKPSMVEFISKGLQQNLITFKGEKKDYEPFKNHIRTLDENGLLLILSEKPLRAKLFYNILLNNILVYFGYKHSVIEKEYVKYESLIKKELTKFNRLKKKKDNIYKQIISEFEISFVHHSLSLEGNPLTSEQTKKIIKQKIIPANVRSEDVDEVRNYQKAILQMLEDSEIKKPLTTENILDYHQLAMQHRPSIAGIIRKREVNIRGNPHFKITKAKHIKKELDSLMETYRDFFNKRKISINELLTFASYFHNEFQHIHPFTDGNSRTTRLITFHLLRSKDIPVLDIPFGLLDEYLSYTKGAKKRIDKNLDSNLQKIILYNLKKINKQLSKG